MCLSKLQFNKLNICTCAPNSLSCLNATVTLFIVNGQDSLSGMGFIET